MSTRTRTRLLSASQRARAASHGSGGVGGSGLPRSRKRHVLSFLTPPRSGSARTADAAASTRAASRCGSAGAGFALAACAGIATDSAALAPSTQASAARRNGVVPSAREGKAELLFDVPGFELDPPVQVHREAG